MQKLFVLFLLALVASSALGQDPTPSSTPPSADETDVVKITTTLIQLDVTVTDRKGNIVTDLRPDEVEIFENGKKQKITNFSFVSNARVVVEKGRAKTPADPNPLPPPAVRSEQVRRTIALVVDDLTLSFESTYYVRRALKKFVDEQMQEGDLVAIIRTGAGIGALQQFTNDKRQLYASIERVRWNSLGSGQIGAFAPLEARIDTGREDDDEEPLPGERTPEGIQREFDDFRESLFATGTLGAINYVVRGMRDLPGRKSVMLLSDGFALFTRDAGGFTQASRVMDSLRRLVDLANRASVVVYTMDARGLQYTGLTARDDTSGRTVDQIEREMTSRRNRLLDTQEGLRYLARQTGGIAIVNNNDLSSGIRRVLDDQSYYLLGYEPDDETFDPKVRRFNNVEIKVSRRGTNVRYRSGFFGVSDDQLVRPQQTGPQRLVSAITSPFAVQDIALRLNALFYSSPKDGNVIRSLVHVRAGDLNFKDMPDGSKRAVFDVLAVGFGDNGVAVEQISKTYTMGVKKESIAKFMRDGFVYDFSFPVKKPGAYQLRIAIRDSESDRIGSANQFVEVPNLKKQRLQLSGAVLENMTLDEWQGKKAKEPSQGPLMDTSLRQFKRGSVLSFGFSIYNAKAGAAGSNLTSQIRLFRDGKQVFEGKPQPVVSRPQPVVSQPQKGANFVDFASALVLGTEMVPGDYVLQIVITDLLAKAKRSTVMQYVQFEVVD